MQPVHIWHQQTFSKRAAGPTARTNTKLQPLAVDVVHKCLDAMREQVGVGNNGAIGLPSHSPSICGQDTRYQYNLAAAATAHLAGAKS